MRKKGDFFADFYWYGDFNILAVTKNNKAENLIIQAARGKTEAAKHFDAAPALSSRQNFILIVFAVVGVYQFILNFHIDLLTG